MNKKSLTETDIRTKFITPAIVRANGEKWDVMPRIADVGSPTSSMSFVTQAIRDRRPTEQRRELEAGAARIQ